MTPLRQAPARSRPDGARRASALMIAMILLSVAGLVSVSAIASAGDDAEIGSLRIETLRAFYAAESGALAAIRQQTINPAAPLTGSVAMPNGQSFVVITPFAASPASAGTVVIEGRAGRATRRVQATFQ